MPKVESKILKQAYKNQITNLCGAYTDPQTTIEEKKNTLQAILQLLEEAQDPSLLTHTFLVSENDTILPVLFLLLHNVNLTDSEKNILFPFEKKILMRVFELDLASGKQSHGLLQYIIKNNKLLLGWLTENTWDKKIAAIIKQHRKEKKEQLTHHHNTNFINKNDRNAINILMQFCYLEDANHYEPIKNALSQLYTHPLFQVMIDFLALMALNKINIKNTSLSNWFNIKSSKPAFRVFGLNDISFCFNFSANQISNNGLYGLYSNKKSIYINTDEYTISDAINTLMHESTHYICQQLFNNESRPFSADDEKNFQHFNKIFQHEISLQPHLAHYAEEDYRALSFFENIISNYPEGEYLAEFIVLVPEVMCSLGPEQGYHWLSKNRPGLLQFFEQHLVAKMKEKLEQSQVNLYLDSPVNYSSSPNNIHLQQERSFFFKTNNRNKASFIEEWAASLPKDNENILRKSAGSLV